MLGSPRDPCAWVARKRWRVRRRAFGTGSEFASRLLTTIVSPRPDVTKKLGVLASETRFRAFEGSINRVNSTSPFCNDDEDNQRGGLSGCSATSLRSLASSDGTSSTFAAGGGMASDKGSDLDASNDYVNLDRRQSSDAIGTGSMPTPAHHEASSP